MRPLETFVGLKFLCATHRFFYCVILQPNLENRPTDSPAISQ